MVLKLDRNVRHFASTEMSVHRCVSMDREPVLSNTCVRITEEDAPEIASIQHQNISSPDASYDVHVLHDVDTGS